MQPNVLLVAKEDEKKLQFVRTAEKDSAANPFRYYTNKTLGTRGTDYLTTLHSRGKSVAPTTNNEHVSLIES